MVVPSGEVTMGMGGLRRVHRWSTTRSEPSGAAGRDLSMVERGGRKSTDGPTRPGDGHRALATPLVSWRWYSASSKCPLDSAISPSAPIRHSSYPLIRTALPVPPGPVLAPMSVQWYVGWLLFASRRSIFTTISGKAVMKPCAASVIAALPIDGLPSLIFKNPSSAKNEATLDASWLHHAA